jgi:hypothetical protein
VAGGPEPRDGERRGLARGRRRPGPARPTHRLPPPAGAVGRVSPGDGGRTTGGAPGARRGDRCRCRPRPSRLAPGPGGRRTGRGRRRRARARRLTGAAAGRALRGGGVPGALGRPHHQPDAAGRARAGSGRGRARSRRARGGARLVGVHRSGTARSAAAGPGRSPARVDRLLGGRRQRVAAAAARCRPPARERRRRPGPRDLSPGAERHVVRRPPRPRYGRPRSGAGRHRRAGALPTATRRPAPRGPGPPDQPGTSRGHTAAPAGRGHLPEGGDIAPGGPPVARAGLCHGQQHLGLRELA